MKFLRIQPKIDNKKRYNYQVNYGPWDFIPNTKTVYLEEFDGNTKNFDFVLLPMYKRWLNHFKLLEKIKNQSAKTVLFDNDSIYRTFDHFFYNDIDFCFYRGIDKNKNKPNCYNSKLKWSVDEKNFTPKYGCKKVSFNCTVNSFYPLRQKISQIIKPNNFTGEKYIENIKNSGASIHTDSKIAPVVRSKILEFASCGTEIISNRVENMNDYFPDDLIIYFDKIKDLKEIINNYKPNIDKQKKLRSIVENEHTHKKRAEEILNILKQTF